MNYQYGQYDGEPFATPDSLFSPPKLMQFIMQYGQQALDAMEKIDGDKEQDYVEQLIASGDLERDEKTGELRLTPKMLQGLEHKALLEVFSNLQRGMKDGHATQAAGRSDERSDGTKRYEFGDPISEIDLGATMRNVIHRQRRESGAAGDGQFASQLPLQIDQGDFELHITEGQADVALCILLDQSGSMMRYGRFYHAKRVAMGMRAMLRRQFPQDTLDLVGFWSLAERLTQEQLALAMPKPISTHDYSVRVKTPLDKAQADPTCIPQHFTNLQLGLQLARQILTKRSAANKQIFIITDGQPTAHTETNSAGVTHLNLIYPPSDRTADITLKEALRCHQAGIRIATFALCEDYFGMDWVSFVDQMTRLIRGVAYYCSSDDLSSTVIESYLSGKRRKSVTM